MVAITVPIPKEVKEALAATESMYKDITEIRDLMRRLVELAEADQAGSCFVALRAT